MPVSGATPKQQVACIICRTAILSGSSYRDVMMQSKLRTCRSRRLSRVRWRCFRALRIERSYSLPMIARYFKVDHTSVLYGLKELEKLEEGFNG